MPPDPPQAHTSTPEQLADLVRQCRADNTPLVDYGIAHQGLGNPPPPNHIRLTQTPTDPHHYPKDMAIQSPAATTFAQLQNVLRQANQFLPIDADDDTSIGEAIAHNTYGPLRVAFGAARELLLGASFIDGNARDVRAGGRTVKNVAGYDLTRFMVGGLGEFGCLYQATLRTYAIPQQVLPVSIALDDPAVFDTLTTPILTSDAAPDQFLLTYHDAQWTAPLAYHGHRDGANARLKALQSLLHQTPNTHISPNPPISFDQDTAERAAQRQWLRTAQTVLKVIVPPAATGQTARTLTQHPAPANNLQLYALPVHGAIFVGGDLDTTTASILAATAKQCAEQHNGYTVWYRRPIALDDQPLTHPTRPDTHVLQKLKAALDPHHLLNPGRLIPLPEQPQ